MSELRSVVHGSFGRFGAPGCRSGVRRRDLLALSSALAVWSVTAPAFGAAASVYAALAATSDFSAWRDLLDRSGLAHDFEKPGGITMLVPTNYAFTQAPDFLKKAQSGPMDPGLLEQVRKLIRSHVIDGLHDLDEFAHGSRTFQNLAGGRVTITGDSDNITVSWGGGIVSGEAAMTLNPVRVRGGVLYPLGNIETVQPD